MIYYINSNIIDMKSARILIVEDEVAVAYDLRRILTDTGYEVLGIAASGEDALGLIKNGNIDLVLMDISLQGDLDGMDTAAILNSHYTIPVVFVTAHSDQAILQRAKNAGAYGYIVKPVDEQQLVITIEITLHKHSIDRSLKESEERYRRLADNMQDMVAVIAPDGSFRYASPSHTAVLGYDPEYIVGKSVAAFIHHDDTECVMNRLREAFEKELLPKIEYRFRHANGQYMWLETTTSFLKENSERMSSIITSTRDITQRKEMEDSLHISEEMFSKAFHSAPVVSMITRFSDGCYVDINETFCKTFGYARNEVIGHTLRDLNIWKYPDDRREIVQLLKKYGSFKNREYILRHKSGRNIEATCSAEIINIGEEKYIIGIATDITKKKELARALSLSEEIYRTVFENTGTAMAIIEEDTTISLANNELCQLTGFTREEITGKMSWTEFVHEDYHEKMLEMHALRRLIFTAPRNYEFLMKTRDGKPRHIYTTVSLIPGTTKSVASYMDITEHKMMEREIVTMENSCWQQLGRDLHDGIGQYLTGISFLSRSLCTKLQKKNIGEAREAGIITGLINESIQATKNIIRGLAPVDLDSGGMSVALQRLAERVSHMYGIYCEFINLAQYDFEDSIIATNVYYIVVEAVNNAVKHSRASRITITLKKSCGRIEIRVKDNGTGILNNMTGFDGRGLKLMKFRANMIRAHFDIQSVANKGTEIVCLLP